MKESGYNSEVKFTLLSGLEEDIYQYDLQKFVIFNIHWGKASSFIVLWVWSGFQPNCMNLITHCGVVNQCYPKEFESSHVVIMLPCHD